MGDAESERHLPWEGAFSAMVAQARSAAQMSQEELARRVREYGVTFHAHNVEKIESGAQPIRLNEALVISKILQVEFPQVTTTVHGELVTQAHSRNLSETVRQWDKIVENLRGTYRKVSETLQGSLDLHASYVEEMASAEGGQDAELLAGMNAIEEQISTVKEGLDNIDGRLNGALSRPSAAASLPGSQT